MKEDEMKSAGEGCLYSLGGVSRMKRGRTAVVLDPSDYRAFGHAADDNRSPLNKQNTIGDPANIPNVRITEYSSRTDMRTSCSPEETFPIHRAVYPNEAETH